MSIPYTLPPNLILNKWLVSSAKADDILLFENRITFKKSTAKTDKKNVKKAEVYKISTGQYQSSSGLFGKTTNIQNIYCCKIIKGSYMVWRGKVWLLRKIPACCLREIRHFNFVSSNSKYTVNGQKWKEFEKILSYPSEKDGTFKQRNFALRTFFLRGRQARSGRNENWPGVRDFSDIYVKVWSKKLSF